MKYTTNYQLPQWVATDRIMMEDFNTAYEMIDTTLNGKLGPVELLSQSTLEQTAGNMTHDLSTIDWNQWSMVLLVANMLAGSQNQVTSLGMRLENISITTDAFDASLEQIDGIRVMVLFPMHDSTRQIRQLLFPGGSIARSSSLYSDITNAVISSNYYLGIREGTTIRVYGIR